jgi:hypothetical protein
MIFLQFPLLVFGIYVLVAGKLPARKTARTVVRGWLACLIGLIAMLPLPLAIVATTIFIPPPDRGFWIIGAVEGSIFVACIVAIIVLALVFRQPVQAGPENVRRT